ncbi:hypothetical protein [Methylophilus sp.]|uniref:hypothetical protein n=1 Tax=Methylophilus sp. TaxID=29541 RepID=UPI000D4B9425|nr:hypothetical protein [Methylophilus sp.]PPD11976.1 MAG: hypothetical protein CTY26_07280 [Methylophilus sp.]
MQPLHLPLVLQLPKSVKPLNGLSFNPSNETWSFNDGVTNYSLNIKKISELTPALVENIRLVLIWYVENTSGGQVESHYWQLVKLLTFIRESHRYPVTTITSADLINYKDSLGLDKEWHLGSLASFLKKWHKFQLPGVAEDALRFLNEVKIKGIEKGKAVRTMDPNIGPFSDVEVEAIRGALNDSYVNRNISKRDFLLTWLFLLLGQRARQYALLKVRAIELALREANSTNNPVLIDGATLNRAAQIISENFAESTAYRIGGQLEMISTFLDDHHLTSAILTWRSPIKRPIDTVRVGKEFDLRRAEKLPSEAALDALPKIFNLATDPKDVIYSSIGAILCSAPDRIDKDFLDNPLPGVDREQTNKNNK